MIPITHYPYLLLVSEWSVFFCFIEQPKLTIDCCMVPSYHFNNPDNQDTGGFSDFYGQHLIASTWSLVFT